MIKHGHNGAFHHMYKPHLCRYVNQFAGCHNIRIMDTINMMGVMAENVAELRLTYKRFISHV